MKLNSTFIMLAAAPLALAEYRPDAFAPIGVMGEHLHAKGQFMGSYRYMHMRMEQNFVGSGPVSDGSVLADPRFMVAPTDMDMDMHMVGFMYAPTDKLTLMAMVNIVELSMNHRRMDGVEFKTSSSGIGDSSLNALLGLWENNGASLHAGLGLLLPTAEIDEEDFIPGPGETRLPYPMQLGSGSWGLAPA
ncbi:transporter, partial [Akkermansiaceae bacterium]|nr:transporter [Akkermansiaceae bacterium]